MTTKKRKLTDDHTRHNHTDFHVAEKLLPNNGCQEVNLGKQIRKGHENNESHLATWDVLSLFRTVAIFVVLVNNKCREGIAVTG
jgi:hypothetical protein